MSWLYVCYYTENAIIMRDFNAAVKKVRRRSNLRRKGCSSTGLRGFVCRSNVAADTLWHLPVAKAGRLALRVNLVNLSTPLLEGSLGFSRAPPIFPDKSRFGVIVRLREVCACAALSAVCLPVDHAIGRAMIRISLTVPNYHPLFVYPGKPNRILPLQHRHPEHLCSAHRQHSYQI
jgi:hypothetical protein